MHALSTLIVDFYDSYTYNLVDLITNLQGGNGKPDVILCDDWKPAMDEWDRLEDILKDFDNIVLSPGPGNPDEYLQGCNSPTKRILDVASALEIPVLGVCLGHQILCQLNDLPVKKIEPAHGVLSVVKVTESQSCLKLFEGIPKSFSVVRYHSLAAVVPHSWPSAAFSGNVERGHVEILATAARSEDQDEDDIVMAAKISSLPHFGVQFHPESILTEYGASLVGNFMRITRESAWFRRRREKQLESSFSCNGSVSRSLSSEESASSSETSWRHLHVQFCDLPVEGFCLERFFQRNMLGCKPGKNVAFWLDNSMARKGGFSFMGGWSFAEAVGDCDDEKFYLQYDLKMRQVSTVSSTSSTMEILPEGKTFLGHLHELMQKKGHTEKVPPENIHLVSRNGKRPEEEESSRIVLPFDFHGGYVGYFGYELKAETLQGYGRVKPDSIAADCPDCAWFFTSQTVVVDHGQDRIFLVSLGSRGGRVSTDAILLKQLVEENVVMGRQDQGWPLSRVIAAASSEDLLRPHHQQAEYGNRVLQCMEEMRNGESYELCFTTKWSSEYSGELPYAEKDSLLQLYKCLRRNNPAPYGCYMEFPMNHGSDSFVILSSSPERFLKVDNQGWAEMKPVKGTCRRGSTAEEDKNLKDFLENDRKNRAENLMIVDLVRNDFSRICSPGSIHCPKLMSVESYKTVHQLVSTVRGKLGRSKGMLDAVRACFPPGSMTGAPKLRSCQILERLENGVPRGVYSGALGFISASGNGTCELSVVIRTIFAHVKDNQISSLALHAGGAITVLSDPEDEWREMLLKAKAPRKVIAETFSSGSGELPKMPGGWANSEVEKDDQAGIFTTMRFENGQILFAEAHFRRLQRSCEYLFRCALPDAIGNVGSFMRFVRTHVEIQYSKEDSAAFITKSNKLYRVKMILSQDVSGVKAEIVKAEMPQPTTFTIGSCFSCRLSLPSPNEDIHSDESQVWTVLMDSMPSKTDSVQCYHKTTRREGLYDVAAKKARIEKEIGCTVSSVKDILLYNLRGEVTELTIGNFAVETSPGVWLTPPLRSGFLPGVMREHLLKSSSGNVSLLEKVFTKADLWRYALEGKRCVGFNALRGVYPVQLQFSEH